MSLTTHIQELGAKHRNVEKQIESELARPGPDDTTIKRLKQRKLELKDQMTRLQKGATH